MRAASCRALSHLARRGAPTVPNALAARSLLSTEALFDDIVVSKSCAARIIAVGTKETSKRLRLAVDGGGCSGYTYSFSIEDDDEATLDPEEDKVFVRDDARVVIDSVSLGFVKGATVDFVQEMIRSSFAIVNNPLSESACGCGSSFAVKNFESNPALD